MRGISTRWYLPPGFFEISPMMVQVGHVAGGFGGGFGGVVLRMAMHAHQLSEFRV
jgi:hypothetical protein